MSTPLTEEEMLDIFDCPGHYNHGKPWKQIIRQYWARDREMRDRVRKAMGVSDSPRTGVINHKEFHRVARELFHYKEVFQHFGNADMTKEVR